MTEKEKVELDDILQSKVDNLLKLRGYLKEKIEKRGKDTTDIIVKERKTGKNILIRVVSESKIVSGNIGVRIVRNMKKDLEKKEISGILIAVGNFTFSAKREGIQHDIELISGSDLPTFNLFEHRLVPKHEIISDEERKDLLTKYRIQPWQLPKIRASDPAVKMIGAKRGDILKITRESPTAGIAVAYRYVL